VNQKSESTRQKAQGRERRPSSRSRFLPTAHCRLPSDLKGFSLIELVITVSVLAILTLGVIPLIQVSVKRQKEQQLREALRQMREAIDQFHREALAGAQMQATQQGQMTTAQQEQAARNPQTQNQAAPNVFTDPRVRVFISDQTIFTADNPDRYPPDLETLMKGVGVLPITAGSLGRRGNQNFTALEAAQADQAIPKTKVYLRQVPIDPMTGKAEWDFRSCYDAAESTSWGGENVFDVRSKSDGKALNGEKYSDW
jgi:general secretion pathway protein G